MGLTVLGLVVCKNIAVHPFSAILTKKCFLSPAFLKVRVIRLRASLHRYGLHKCRLCPRMGVRSGRFDARPFPLLRTLQLCAAVLFAVLQDGITIVCWRDVLLYSATNLWVWYIPYGWMPVLLWFYSPYSSHAHCAGFRRLVGVYLLDIVVLPLALYLFAHLPFGPFVRPLFTSWTCLLVASQPSGLHAPRSGFIMHLSCLLYAG